MKLMSIAAAAAFLSTPASAITYQYDFGAGTSFSGGTFTVYPPSGPRIEYTSSSPVPYDILITGFVETDGTLGTVSSDQFLSWEFTLVSPLETWTISSEGMSPEIDGTARTTFSVWGDFVATTETLTPTLDDFTLFRNTASDSTGSVLLESGIAVFSSGFLVPYYDRYFSLPGFDATALPSPDSALIGTAITPVPLPASAAFLLAGLGGLALVRRKTL